VIRVQPDMKQFWDDTLRKLREVPLEPQTKRIFEDHPVLEIYEVSFNGWGGKRVYAALYVPKSPAGRPGPKPLPVIVSSHPGTTDYDIRKDSKGLYGAKVAQDLRFVQITPFLRNKPGEDPGFNLPWWGSVTSRDDYIARDWYCRMVRAVDYLATRPDLVDMKRIVATGGSQGGALALVTAGLDHRVAYCFSDCPANCQPYEIMHSYGSFGPSLGIVPEGMTAEDVERVLSYYNPVNFCPWIQCPTYVGSNIGDLTVHSMGPLAAYHNLTSLRADGKDFFPGFTHAHGSGPGLWTRQQVMFEKIAGPPAGEEGTGQ
jgi:cephalosporin-C deacetylase-like acetyl esterase